MIKDLIDRLREHAEWASANEWETPITLAKDYCVSDNAIRKWCIAEKLPSTKKEIKKYTDKEWDNI